MSTVRPHTLPAHSLLSSCAANGYADCFVADIAGSISHAQYVEAFYTTWLFRLERFVLRWAVARPSTDLEARELAQGKREKFAAWSVESRAPEQLLVRDYQGKTCSWLMIEPRVENGAAMTRLYFGTGIASRRMSSGFRALLPFHKFYARALLSAARSRLLDNTR